MRAVALGLPQRPHVDPQRHHEGGFARLPQGIAPQEDTPGELLRDAGYRSTRYGQWHLGNKQRRNPTEQGFEKWWGFVHSSGKTLNHLQAGWSAQVRADAEDRAGSAR
jgi:arylsulfatase A-like enzyme